MPSLLFVVTEASYFFSHRLPIAKAAQRAGYDVTVATQITPDTLDRFKRENMSVIPLKHLKRASLSPWNQWRTLHELYRIYRRLQPTLVHHVAMKPVLYGTIVAWFARVPHVVNAITGLGFMFISPTFIARTLRFFFITLLRFFSRSTVYYILQNKDDRRLFSKFIAPKQCVLIRGSGVDTKHFRPENKPRPQMSPFTVGIPARLLWDKGIGEAVEAQRILEERGVSLTLILAGALDPQNPSHIPAHTLTEWQSNHLVRWDGKIKDMRAFFKTLDLVLLPSYREGLPLALLEAASMGLPIITTDVPGCREVVIDRATGLLLPPKNPVAIADALEFCVAHRERLPTWGQKGRTYVVEHFSQEHVIKETLGLYKKLTQK